MTVKEANERLDRISGDLRRIRAESDKRYREAGPQQAKDHDTGARWQGKDFPKKPLTATGGV